MSVEISEGFRVRRRSSEVEGTVIAVCGKKARVEWDRMTTGWKRGGSCGITTEIALSSLIAVGFVDREEWNYLCAKKRGPERSIYSVADTIPF